MYAASSRYTHTVFPFEKMKFFKMIPINYMFYIARILIHAYYLNQTQFVYLCCS